MSNLPLVSIMLPTFNSVKTLPMAIGSILVQKYTNWECIIVDDGSTDTTGEFVRAIDDNRIKYIKLPENKGRGVARQVALNNCTGTYLAMIDSDDWWFPEKLDKQMNVLKRDVEIAMLSTNMAVFDDSGEIVSKVSYGDNGKVLIQKCTPKMLNCMPLPFPASVVKMEIAKSTGFDARLKRAQDADFVYRGVLSKKYGIITENLYAYYNGNVLSKKERMVNLKYRMILQLKQIRKYPLIVIFVIMKILLKRTLLCLMPQKIVEKYFKNRNALLSDIDKVRYRDAYGKVSTVAQLLLKNKKKFRH